MVLGLGRDPFRKQICQWNRENGGQSVASPSSRDTLETRGGGRNEGKKGQSE